MAGTTEIYLCRKGQTLKQGRVQYSDSIETKADAEADATQRCKWDKKLAKIGYYAVNEAGDFRVILTYNNPNLNDEDEPKKPKKIKKIKKKAGLFDRVIKAVSGPGKSKKKKKS